MITIAGGGPAGSAAALAALSLGAKVRLFEPSRLPRHKVCGEFLSPEFAEVATKLGVWDRLRPHAPPIHRMALHLGRTRLVHKLRKPAHGLSRHTLDRTLLEAAIERGAAVERARCPANPDVVASGRAPAGASDTRAQRLFGFKAHYSGPADDCVDLFFFTDGYAGVSPVENGLTNVCGLAPEQALEDCGWRPERLLQSVPALERRLALLERAWDWIFTGPLRPGHRANSPDRFRAGDAWGFVDPFTGSGLTNALITGLLAGHCAATGRTPVEHDRLCRRALDRALHSSALLRRLLAANGVEHLARLAPPGWLYRATRPRLAGLPF